MTPATPIPPITGTVTISVPIDRAFEVFTWQINGSWQFDPDPARASQIEARFAADGPGRTTVEVEQRYFERLVGGQSINDAINGGGGWALLLDGFAKSTVERA
jgi:hypothetical protein